MLWNGRRAASRIMLKHNTARNERNSAEPCQLMSGRDGIDKAVLWVLKYTLLIKYANHSVFLRQIIRCF